MKPLVAWKPVETKFASAKYRALLPCKYLREEGYNCEIFDPKNSNEYQLVIFQKTYSEGDIELAKSLKTRSKKVILDICDNEFYNPFNNHKQRYKIDLLKQMIEVSDIVSVSTEELKKCIQGEFENKKIIAIDDAVELEKVSPLTDFCLRIKNSFGKPGKATFNIIWFGNNRTIENEGSVSGIPEIKNIIPSLEALNFKIPLHLTVISNSKEIFESSLSGLNFSVKYIKWNSVNFPYLIKRHQACIIPITPNPFTVCKTNNRPLLSLLMGVPVVADKIPSYEEFGDFILFSDWENNLEKYAVNQQLRRLHVESGRKFILSKYTRERVIFQWKSLINDALSD